MLQSARGFSSFSVNDIEAAKKFYGDLLGFSCQEEGSSIRLNAGGCEVMIYEKGNHESASFTVLNFAVDSVDDTVDALIAKGITFEQYDMGSIQTDEKGIARNERGTIAWMQDPAGNIVAVLNM